MHRLLFMGCSGSEVADLQKALNAEGTSSLPALGEDGIFGLKTRARVVEFQGAQQLAPDGLVGAKTRDALQQFFDLVKGIVAKITTPTGEEAARKRVVDLAQQYQQNHGWQPGDVIGAAVGRIAANRCADESTRARQGGTALAAVFTAAGVTLPPPSQCLTISKTAERNYRDGAAGRNQWDLPSWCGIFALHVYRSVGLKTSSWPLRIQGLASNPDFKPVLKADHVKPGDLGIFDFRPNHVNHHFIVVDIKGDMVTSIDGNITTTIGGERVQTVAKRSKFSVGQIMKDPFSAFVTPIWSKWV